jgi:hypothetical protein
VAGAGPLRTLVGVHHPTNGPTGPRQHLHTPTTVVVVGVVIIIITTTTTTTTTISKSSSDTIILILITLFVILSLTIITISSSTHRSSSITISTPIVQTWAVLTATRDGFLERPSGSAPLCIQQASPWMPALAVQSGLILTISTSEQDSTTYNRPTPSVVISQAPLQHKISCKSQFTDAKKATQPLRISSRGPHLSTIVVRGSKRPRAAAVRTGMRPPRPAALGSAPCASRRHAFSPGFPLAQRDQKSDGELPGWEEREGMQAVSCLILVASGYGEKAANGSDGGV